MSDGHFIETCECGAVITQCKCPGPHKEIRTGICEKCKKAQAEKPSAVITKWQPTSAEMMKAMLMVLTDKLAATDAIFWHGSPTNSKAQDRRSAQLIRKFHESCFQKPTIVINGLSAATCKAKNLCYPGCEVFWEYLLEEGVYPKYILHMDPAHHTAAESEALLLLARGSGWKSLTIVSQPHHQLRCFLQIIASMKKLGIFIKAFNRTTHEVSWHENLKKPVLGGGEIDGTLADHVLAEDERITKYAQKDGIGFTPHATIPEMFEYLKTRDAR